MLRVRLIQLMESRIRVARGQLLRERIGTGGLPEVDHRLPDRRIGLCVIRDALRGEKVSEGRVERVVLNQLPGVGREAGEGDVMGEGEGRGWVAATVRRGVGLRNAGGLLLIASYRRPTHDGVNEGVS